jgi:hypothetical protein
MGKAARNRRIRALARSLDATHARSIARAFRRRGRMPLPKKEGQR